MRATQVDDSLRSHSGCEEAGHNRFVVSRGTTDTDNNGDAASSEVV